MGITNSMYSQGGLIDNYINTSYDVVKSVHDNLDSIITLGEVLANIGDITANIDSISTVGASINSINLAAANLTNIAALAEVVPTVNSYTVESLITNNSYVELSRKLYLFKSPINVTVFNALSIFKNSLLLNSNRDYTITTDFYEGAYRTAITFSNSLVHSDILTLVIGTVSPEPVINVVQRTKQALSVTIPNVGVTVVGDNTVVDLNAIASMSYTQNENQLLVIVNGVFQSKASGAFIETSPTTITLTGALNTGDVLDIFKVN